ncbi:hydroxyacylglutathione hydrolase [Pararhizobium mangrovi]|uniref:Hydroxyacylglutathione hydrolase n=1 Tax=Pararhizobium mangrovi TaxID=2590452 RepID=A0A506U1D9_9HYPH|nr:hydroxyacylglutathione hydrolase [Pararhizobium mangrovi]TPW27306.1 hydroxyacylglutathione hydrolase [Pararhizobium mangrovi]
MAELEIHQFMCRSDNFGVLLHDPESGETASIDAPEAEPILTALDERGWKLTHIFTTHHHGDHVEGNEALKERFGCTIIGPRAEADSIPGIDRTVVEGDRFTFAGHPVEVIETPGHTAGHVSYHMPDDGLLFAADTLFALGCGRVFEGTPDQMWSSLKKLRALPASTIVYCGHEYTLANARFAVTVDPDNLSLQSRARDIETLREADKPTLPTTIAEELVTNPFLRPDDADIRAHLGMSDATDAEVFAEIRSRKDRF